MIRQLLSALFVIAVLAAPVMAGGSGGTKKDATVRFTNDVGEPVGVIVNPTPAQLMAIDAAPDTAAALKALTDAGGRLVQPGKSTNFSVKAGVQQIGLGFVNGGMLGDPFTITRSVGKGKTLRINASSVPPPA